MPDQAQSRLEAALNEHRLRRRLRWNQVAAEAGISTSHLARLRNGDSPLTELSQAALEHALGLEPGTLAEFRPEDDTMKPSAGERPTLSADQGAEIDPAATAAAISQMQEMLLAAMARIDELSAKVAELDQKERNTHKT